MLIIKKIGLLTTFLLAIIACDLTEPFSLPSWDTQWKIFFRNDNVTLREMLEDGSLKDSLSAQYGDTLIFVSISDVTEHQAVDEDELTFEPDGDQIAEEVGDIELDDPTPQTTDPTSLEELLSVPINVDETIGPIPAQDIAYNPGTKSIYFDEFQRIILNEGIMYLTFHNNLIFDITPGMVVSVYDSVTSTLLYNFTFDQGIEQGQSFNSDTLLLNDQLLYNAFYLDYIVIPIVGIDSVHTITQADVNSNFTADLKMEGIIVREAEAKIPEQDIDRLDASLMDIEDKILTRALIDSGYLDISVENTLEIDANVVVHILSLVDESNNNQPMVIDTFLARGSTTNIRKSIKGKTIINHESPGGAVDSIRYQITGTTVETEDYRHVESSQVININFELGQVKTSEFEGQITILEIDIDPVEKSDLLGLEDIRGSFRLPDLELVFDFFNQIGFDVLLDLEVTGIKEENGIAVDSVKIIYTGFQIDRAPDQNSTQVTRLILNSTTTIPSIVDLMEILPTTIKVEGSGTIENQTGKVNLGDALWAEYRIESPMRIRITNDLIYDTDIDTMELDKDARKELSENIDDVLLKLNPVNGIPLNIDLIFVLTVDTTDMFSDEIADSTEKIVLHKTIEAAIVDAEGLVTHTTITDDMQLKLNKTQLEIFNKKDGVSGKFLPVYNGMQIRVDSDNQPVIFRNNDALNYDGYLDLKYKVNAHDE